jgi:hypothetical protein
VKHRPYVPLVLGAGTIVTPLGFVLLAPARDSAPVFQSVGWLALGWHIILATGGVLILSGWLCRRSDLEAAGYVAASTGAFFYAAAAFYVRGWAAWTGGCLIATLAGAELGRALSTIKGRAP